QAWKVAGIFLYRGQKIASIAGRPPIYHTRNLLSYNEKPDDYPLVVLTNRLTASSAEIVAGALQDHDRALIVGERTFGKGLVQSLFELADGSALTLTTGRYRTPSGRLIQRDYSRGSFYDYYLQRNYAAGQPAESRYQTDAGRAVYGGGGITPDVEIAPSPREGELQQLWLDPVFEFVRQLVAGQVRGLETFRIDKPADHAHRLADDEYLVNDEVISAFKAFLRERREIKVDRQRVDKDAGFLKRQIRFELVTAAYGQDTALKVLLEADSQAQQAVADIPKAAEMAEALRQVWTTVTRKPQASARR
ncbi:MAG TPA: S41 family peptidase, partial [Blastocatellia bacterium]|nr:S41 family peptidase [Blastocatellia bacterium]